MAAKSLDPVLEPGIKRLLRHRASKAYFKDGGWTRNVEEADNFTDVVKAAEACVRYGLSDVELALRYQASTGDVFCTPIR
jgi:stalled ribosome rescue protein Dom34